MAKVKTEFICSNCGYKALKWLGRCPECQSWNTFLEEKVNPKNTPSAPKVSLTRAKPRPLKEVQKVESERLDTKIGEVNRVLGGGMVRGSLVLLSGDPGIGKSTLTMQIMANLAKTGRVLYISGEESAGQIQNRAERLGVAESDIVLLTENDVSLVHELVLSLKPVLIVLDSIQTTFDSALGAAPGSVSQLRAVTSYALSWAKNYGFSTILIGHVTKDGQVAGPRVLEHMVDTVLFFEGDHHYQYRLLRALKNRFGSTNELGIFDMTERGLKEVLNPSETFLKERPLHTSGSAIGVLLEGSRPILLEVQALVTSSVYGQPRRMATGTDYNRVAMLLAVLEKRAHLPLSDKDVYVNVVGGLVIDEPAGDLAIAVAMASAFLDKVVRGDTVVIGELGLTGELRQVQQLERRLKEVASLGYKRVIVPPIKDRIEVSGVELVYAKSLYEVFQRIWE